MSTLDERLARHQITADRLMANHTESPACTPGHRAQIAIERGIDPADPNVDLTDIEHWSEYEAAANFTPLEIRQIERKVK